MRLTGASCASCVSPIRRNLERIRGVEWVEFNSVLDLITVDYDPGLIQSSEIMNAIKRAGYSPTLDNY